MRLRIVLRFPNNHNIPIQYNYFLQSAIYKAMDKVTGNFVHDQGFTGAGRIFRFFTFSRLLGRFELSKDRKSIVFPEGCQLVVSSPLKEILGAMAGGFLQAGVLGIGPVQAEITEVRVENSVLEGVAALSKVNERGIPEIQRVRVRTLSPVVAYSTMLRGDGSKYTVYFQPGEPEFQRLVAENLQKKLVGLQNISAQYDGLRETFGFESGPLGSGGAANGNGNTVMTKGGENEDDSFQVRTIGRPRLHIIQYKGGVIKGYSALLELHGPRPLLQLALEAGLGSKNAQGFGCLEVVG